MAKQTYTIKFGIDANDFIRELTALQSQLQNIASSMDVGLSADRVKEFSSGLNTILKNYTTAISKQDFSAMQSSLDGVYEEAIKIQKALGSDIKIDGLLSSLGRAKSTLGEFRDMTTTVSGAAISAAENIASAQQRAANQSKEASQVATVSLEQQKQKLAELQSMQQMLAGYANKRGNADKNKIKTSLVTDDLEINDSNEMHLYDVADRIKETYADLAKEMSSIDWSKAAGDPEQLQKTLSLLQQCSEMYRLIHSSDTQDILESAKFNGDQLDGSPIKTLEQAFASENEMSQKAADSLKEFSSAFEGVVDQFTKKFSTIYQAIQAQAEAQADVVKSIESGVTATNMQVQADTNAAEAAERKAQAQREAAAALSSMAGTKHVVDSNDDVINLANARQHTIKIKLSVGNPKEFLSQMQSAMADAQQIANAGIKVKAEISNDMISTVTKKYSKSGSTEQEIAINIVAKEKDNQSKVVSGVRSRLQEEAEKNPVRIPIKVEFKDAAGSIDEVKKKAEAELQKEADSIIPTTGAKATIKHKLASAEATDAVAQAKASVKNAQQMMSETLASLDAQTEKPITFAVKFNPDLAAVQQQFNDAIAAVRATAAEPVAIGTKIDDTIASLQGDASSATPIKIPVVPDAEMFKSGIATLIESASTVTPIKIPVAPDVEALLSKLSEVKASNTEVAVGFDATTATANFEALINSLAEKSNVAIKTTLDSDEMYNNFNAVVKKMRDRMSAHPIKVHIELAKSDLDNLNADDAWKNHLQSMTQLAKAEGDALDSVLGKAKELQADIEASAKQLPSLIKLLQTYQKTGGNNKQAGPANRAKSSERSAIRSTEKYTNESARVLNNIAQYENYNSPDMQAQVTAIASLNKELIQARDNLFAITRDKKSSPDDVTRAFDKFNVTLSDTRGRLRDAASEAAGLNREFVATRNDAQKKISDVKSSIAQMDKYVQNLPEQKIQKFYKDYQDYTKNIRAESEKFLSTASNPSSARSSIQSQYDDFIKYYRTIWRGVQSMSADKSYNMLNADKAFTKGSVFADNVASLDAFQAQVQQRLKSYKEFNGDFVNNGTQWIGTYRDASGAVKNLTLAMDQSKQVAREYSSDIKQPTSAMQQMGAVAQRAANYLVSSLATLVSFRMVIDYVRTGIGYVQQLDTALAQLQVVTGQSAGALNDAEAQARSIGDAIGSTTTEILNSATDWARLGYSMSDSLTLAEKSAELAKTGFMSVSTATEQMTASIQAFYGAQIGKGLVSVGDAAEHVNDELVAIGNNMPITSEGLGAALERSAGSLVAAGNSLEQSVALISAANSTIQNPESVGTALKTVSMRLRGTKVSDISNEVGEDVSDDFKNAAQDASKLYNTIKKLTAVKANDFKGVSILTDTGAYKSTYSIIKEIASAWNQMSDINQAALLEQIAGKRQASAIAAIFQDPELLQKGEDYANNAAGATAKAMDTVLDTIEVRISRLQNEAQTFWQELINSNDVKKLIDGLSTALKLTNSLVTASHGVFNGNGTAGLLGLLAGSTQSAFNKLRNGANSSGGLISFTGTGTYVGGVKLGKSGAASYSSVMGNDGLVYSADDIAAVAKVSKALREATSASSSFDDALQKSGIDFEALSDNGRSLIATMKSGTAGADELVVRSQALAKGFNASGEALKAFGRSLLSSLASGLVMAGISVAISAIASAVDNYVHRLDTAIDKGKEFSQSIQQQTKQYSDNQDQIESLREEYTSLSRGVDEHGKNVSLTADQYKRYKEIVAQIVQLSPELAKGYSDENGYLVDRNKLIDEAIAKQKEYTAEAQRSRFTSNNFATEMNAQLATVQQSKQSSIKGQKSWFERVTSSKTWLDYLTRFQTPTDRDKLLNADDIYAEAQQNFIGQLQKLYSSSSNSTEKTLDEYLQSQFGISGATLDNVDKIAKSISKITAGLKPQNDNQATQFNNQITALDKAATNWVNDAETVDSVNQAVRDNFTSFVENAVAGYDKLNDAQKNAIRNSISNLTYADILKGNKTEQDQSILYDTWEVDDTKRRQQQDKYTNMVKLLQNSAVQRTMSNASKIDTSLNYADYEKQYKNNLKKIEKVLNSTNKSEGLSLEPADIKQLVTLTPVDQDGNDLHADPQAMVDRLKATLVDGEKLVKDMTLDQINVTYPVVQEFAEEHPGVKVDLDQAKRLVNLQVRIEELKNKSVASYSNLKTQVESYTTALSGLNDITANNQIITTDMYNTLQSAGVGVEDLNSVVREFGVDSEGYTTYLVENIDKLKEFTKVANDAAKTDISANIDAQRRRYAELVEQLDQVIGENYDYVKSNHTLTESRKDDVRSIQEQLDQTEDLLDSYAALQSQVSATANAYSAYQKAKEYDARTDFGSEAIEMVSELANDLANATYGTEAFKSAMNAIVPKSALTNMDNAIQRIKDTQKYLNSLDSQHYFKKDSDGALQGLDYETFVKNGLKSQNGIQVFTGTEGNFRLNDTITDIQQVEKAFGMTLPMVQAFDEALKRAGVTSRSMFASLSGDDSQNQIYRTLQNLNDAENQLQEAINQGVDTAPFKKKVDDAKADIDDLANGARQRVSDYLNAMDQMNELDVRGGTEGQREALEAKLNQKPTQLDVELVDKNLDSEIETLQNGAKQKKIELYAKINHVDASNVDSDTVDKWAQNRLSRDLELKKNSSIYLDDESNAAQSEMDKLTQSLDSVKSSSGDLVKSLDNAAQAVNNLSSVMSGGSSAGVKSEGAKNSSKQTAEVNVSNATANKNIKQTEDAGAKLYDIINNGFASINLKNQDALSKVASFKNAYLDAVNTVNQNPLVMQAETGIAFTKSGSGGVSKKKGKAKANGGIVNGESRALVGELGQELVVNPNTGKYYTVGDSGAEFVSLPKNAIVFNHLQTKQLLGGNHTGSRGTALASGNAYVDSSGGNNGILGAFTTTLTPTTDKSSKATSAAKSAGKEISKAAKEAADDWITAFKNAAEKLRNNYTSGKMDAEQYFDALTKLYQQYYDGYGRKSDENLKKLKDAWTAIYNTEASDLDTKRSNGEITERQYLDGLRNLYKRFYGDLNVYAKEYADAQKDFAQKAKSAYQNVLQAGSSVVSHQIKQLQNQMNGAVSALQAQKDAADRSFEMQLRPLNAEIKHYEKLQKALNKQIKAKTKEQNAIEKVITAKNKEISAIQEAAQARQTDLDLQKAQYELARAEHQRTQYTYTSDKGFVYRSNPTNVKDARENLKEKTENSRVQQINNEINALTKEKEAIQDEIDKIQEVIDRYADKIDAIQEQIDAIQELKDATDQYYDDAIYNIQQQYQTQIDALQKIQDMWDQASDMFDFATSLQLLESFGLSLSDVTNNAGASIDLVKGKLADVLAYMYQNNDAAKQVWSTILGIDLSQITPNIDNFALGIKGVSDYASMASGNVRSLNGDLSAAQMSGMMAQGGLIGAANAATQLGTAASTTSPQELANTMAQLSATDMTGFSNAIGSLTANAASLDALNASLTQTLAIMQGLGAQDTFGALYNQFVAFVTNFEALANQFQQDMTVLFGQGQAAGNDKNSQSAGWFDGFVQQVEDMNERTSAALQNQIEQWTNFQQLMVGVLGVDGNGGGDKGGEGGQGQQSGDGGSTASSGSASADSIIGSLILAATEMNEAFMKWEETLNEFIVGEGGFTDFTNQVMEMITNMANTIKEQCEAAISAINEMVEAVASANAALASMSFSVGSSGASHPAHAAGAPTGLKHDEHHALVGELGPETVVSGDKYRVVGKHGAELVNLKRGDIVLNHQQTARLFKSGAAHASGIGNLIPAGQPAFMNKLANISSDILSANMKQLTPRLFTGVNVKLAAADGGGTSVIIKDLHVSLPNFNSDKADDLIRDLSSMTLKAVQKYNRH